MLVNNGKDIQFLYSTDGKKFTSIHDKAID